MLLVSKHPKEEEVALFMKFIWRKSSCSGEPENEVSGYVRFSKPIVIYLKISSLSQTTPNIYSFEIMNRKRTMDDELDNDSNGDDGDDDDDGIDGDDGDHGDDKKLRWATE